MGIFDRLSILLRANVTDLIERAEDPEKVANQLVLDMASQLTGAKSQVAIALAEERRLFARYESAQRQADDWQRKAELAVTHGDDELARGALIRRNSHAKVADGLHEQWQAQSTQNATLREALRALESKLNEAKAKRDLLIARDRRAKASERVHKTLSKMNDGGAFSSLDRLERRVEEREARAAAYADLNSDRLEDRLAALERESILDQQLAQLKARKRQPDRVDSAPVEPFDVVSPTAPRYEDIEHELRRLKAGTSRLVIPPKSPS